MRQILVWATVASGVIAAYLMLRRGAPVTEVAKQTVGNPVGALVDELKTAS